MSDILNIILPVFMLIGVGYGAAIFGLLKRDVGDALSRFIFVIAIPALLIKVLATADFSGASPWALWGAYFCGVGIIWLMAKFTISNIMGRDLRSGVIAGVSAGFSNLVLTGIPLISRAYGEEGIAILVLLVAVHMPVMMTISTLLMEHAVRADGVEKSSYNLLSLLKTIAKNLLTNPIIMGIFAGIAWRFSGLGFSGMPADLVQTIGATAGPLALISIGLSLNKYGIKGNLKQASALAGLSLVALPVVVYFLSYYVFALPPLWLKVAVLGAALPTGVNAYLFASHFKVAEGLATNTIILTIISSLATLSFWLWFLG
jgi:predicted permease